MIILGSHHLVHSFSGSSKLDEPKVLRTIASQTVPRFVYEEYPKFSEFIETFLDFIEQKYDIHTDEFRPGPYYILKKLVDTVDIDRAASEYLQYFKRTYARDFPNVTEQEIRSLLKRIKDFYLRKGTVDSFDFFFRSVFASFSEIYLPKRDMLRVSDGKWYVENQIRLKRTDGDLSYLSPEELVLIYDSYIEGMTSKASAWLGFPVQALIIGSMDTTPYYWMPVLARKGEFLAGETVKATLPSGEVRSYWIGNSDSIQTQPGRWLNSDGFLSSDKRIQDSFYWQDFSYVIRTDSSIAEFTNPMVNTLHPAGFRIFASIEDIEPEIIEVYPGDFNFLYSRELIIWLRNWDLITGSPEIPEISGMTGAHLRTVIRDGGEGQAFIDWGFAGRTKETEDISNLFPNISSLDGFLYGELETGDPKASLFVSIGGRKIVCSDEPFEDSTSGWKDIRVTRSDFGSFDIDATDFELFELDSESMMSMGRLSVQVLPSSDYGVFHRIVAPEEISEEYITIRDLSNVVAGQVLVFVNGKKVIVTDYELNDYVDENDRTRMSLYLKNPDFETANRSLIEIFMISGKNMRAAQYAQVPTLVDGTPIKRFNFTDISPSIELGTRSPWDFLVFQGWRHLRPAVDYFISDDGNEFHLRTNITGSPPLEIYFLKPNQASYSYPLTASVISGTYGLPKPTGELFNRVPGRLLCSGMASASSWINFDQERYGGIELDEFTDAVDPSHTIQGYSGVSGDRNGSLVPFGAPNGSATWRVGDGANEAMYATASLAILLKDMRPTNVDPFSIGVRFKFPVDFVGGELVLLYSTSGTAISIYATPTASTLCDFDISGFGPTGSLSGYFGELTCNVFYTLVVTYDGTDVNLYVNDALVDSNPMADIYVFDSADNLFIGAYDDGTSPTTGLEFESLAFFNHALNPIDIKAFHNGGYGLPGPQKYF